jgi:CheY-like chemotaxis protein
VLDLSQAVSGTVGMLARLIGEDIDLEWRPQPGLWPVRLDPSQLDQILTNLCVNARDSIAESGHIHIEVANVDVGAAEAAAQPGFTAGAYVMLTVRDDGEGMSPATLSHIFEPFFTTKELGKGTGLGLATVYGIVKQNQGFIDVQSAPGQGTTFRIYFPRHDDTPAVRAHGTATPPLSAPQAVILLVEDEPSLLAVTRRVLVSIGYAVLAAGSPEEAQRIASGQTAPIDLLLTDVVMPGMNGQRLAATLRQRQPGLRCLFMSGYPAEAVLEEGAHFIQKPFSGKALATKVFEALGRSPEGDATKAP